MKNIYKFHFKRIIHSLFFLSGFLAVLISFLLFNLLLLISRTSFISYVVQFDHYVYFEVVLTVIVFCIAVYYFRQESELEIICFYPKAKILTGKMLAILSCSLTLCLIPIIFVAVNAAASRTEPGFSIAALLYVIIRWSSIILVSQSAAFLSSYFIKGSASYVLCLPAAIIFSYLNQTIVSLLLGHGDMSERVSAFFSMQEPYVSGMDVEYVGARTDLFLLVKYIYVLVFAAIAIALIWTLCSQRKKVPIAVLVVLFVIEAGSIYAWSVLYPTSYAYADKLFVGVDDRQVCTISAYSGNFDLKEFSRFDCDVEILPAGQQAITFRLDECLAIDQIVSGGEDIPYTRTGDYVTVSLPYETESPVTLSFRYSGRIYYVSDIHSINIYATVNGAALPAKFAFLPIIDGDDTSKDYSLNVRAHNTVISNLDVEQAGGDLYTLSGDAKTCCIFAGYFSEYEQDGILFYRAKYNDRTKYSEVYEQSLTYRYFDAFTFEYKQGPYTRPDKIFIIYSQYGVGGFPIVYDDYVLVNYGYPFS